jgi:hypothetical protein
MAGLGGARHRSACPPESFTPAALEFETVSWGDDSMAVPHIANLRNRETWGVPIARENLVHSPLSSVGAG